VVIHELSHIMLGHELASAGMTEDGHLIPSNYDREQEDEADWLGGALLLPRPALLVIRRRRITDAQAMLEFQVSQKMLTWRFRMTGVDYQLANAQKKWAR
jgi:Zn-dependent peptidase ImmA (M78 family)